MPGSQRKFSDRFRQEMIWWLQAKDSNGEFSDVDALANGWEPMTVNAGIEIATRWAKGDVVADINTGKVPQTVKSFSELHDYVDANWYGGAFDWPCGLGAEECDEGYVCDMAEFWDVVQGNVDEWIKAGQPDE